jgi:hypothetical protein
VSEPANARITVHRDAFEMTDGVVTLIGVAVECDHGGALQLVNEAILEDHPMMDSLVMPLLQIELHKHTGCACRVSREGLVDD